MLGDIKAAQVGRVIAWHSDRLLRRPRDLEDLIPICEDAGGIPIHFVMSSPYDLTTASGRLQARIAAAVDAHESEHKSERIKRKHQELAEQGLWSGGGTRPFGFEDDRKTVNRHEAAYIRKAAERVLAGETVRSICAAWNERGIRTPTGKEWTVTSLRRILTAPRTAGWRQYDGVLTHEAEWPGIIDLDTHKRLVALLTDKNRRLNHNARRYLLAGFLRCDLCKKKLVARPRADKRRCYVCASGPGFNGCGKIRVLSEPLEDFVKRMAFVATDGPDLAERLARRGRLEPSDDQAEVDQLVARLDELAETWAADEITRQEWLTARRALERRLDAARSRLATSVRQEAVNPLLATPGALRRAWEGNELSFDQKRAVLAALFDRIPIRPAVRGRNFFDPNRVGEPEWRV